MVGGGFLTALAVPLIDLCGLPVFTIAGAAVTVALAAWGIKRAGHWSGELSQSGSEQSAISLAIHWENSRNG